MVYFLSDTLLNMTLTGSVVILFVLLARLCLRKAPKVLSYALWALVLFRLLCPVSITAPISAMNLVRPEVTGGENYLQVVMYVANAPAFAGTMDTMPVVSGQENAAEASAPKVVDVRMIAAAVWAAGFLAMSAHGIAGFLRTRRRLTGAVEFRKGILLADGIDMPFVMGILHPRICLPSSLPAQQRPYILAHERVHIRRKDMLWKLLGYMALCLHWFNPLVWLGFMLAGKDMEMSCDEAVLRRMDDNRRADYAAALLSLSTGRWTLAVTPLAFGEGDVKSRIRSMAAWKKPAAWATLACVLLFLAAAGGLLTNPIKRDPQPSGKYELTTGPQSENFSRITPGPCIAVVGDISCRIPDGMTLKASHTGGEEDMQYEFWSDDEKIGGIFRFPMEFVPGYDWEWLRRLPLPEWDMENIGYFADSSGADAWSVEFFSDVPPGVPRTVRNRHELRYFNGCLYDIWFDALKADAQSTEQILNSVRFGEALSDLPAPDAVGAEGGL